MKIPLRVRTEISGDTSARIVLHEVLAASGQAGVAAAFGLALAQSQSRERTGDGAREIVWCQQDTAAAERGDLSGDGLAAFGVEPGRMLLVRLRTPVDVLRAALEAVRCSGVGAVVVERKMPVDLTASRRLKLAAEKSGVMLVVVRHTDAVIANAAQVRWRVDAAPSKADRKAAWGRPTFDVTLLKNPAGLPETRWIVEWDCERHIFIPALPWPVAAVPVGRLLAV